LLLNLGAIGNYAIKTEGATIYIAFEEDADADRLAAVLRPKQTTRELEWALPTKEFRPFSKGPEHPSGEDQLRDNRANYRRR
jgi:hypothetical protein